MKETKYQAWDSLNKKMLSWEDIGRLEMEGEMSVHSLLSGEYAHFTPLNYTGLTDRNGKEIYEGDYIKCPELYETPESTGKTYITTGNIVFEEGVWRFSDGGLVFEEYDSYDGDFEVVGNMYEHSHKIEVS